ncbi:MAG: hypothetical protein ACK5OX_11350 [Desertimonas sp.]
MGWIGADLAALDALATRFTTTSEACRSHAQAIATKAHDTVDDFARAMADLDREARVLHGDIGTSVAALRTQADATTWTGTNRVRQDEILAVYEADVTALQTSIDTFLGDAGTIVAGSLTMTVGSLQTDVTTSGETLVGTAEAFSTDVARQRRSFDAVMNGAV